MTTSIRPDERKILQFLYEKQALHPLQALAAESLAQQMGIPWNDLRYQIDRLHEEEFLVLKARQIRARIFYTLYLTAKGQNLVEASATPPPPSVKYHNFDLHLLPTTIGLRIEVLNSPAGEAVTETPLPAAVTEFAHYVFEQEADVQPDRPGSHPTPMSLAAIGDQIGQLLLSGAVRDCFKTCMGMLANRKEDGLRIRLRIYDHQLAAIPWELARIDGEYLCLRLKTSLVRYIPTSEPPGSLRTDGALRILGIISNPTDLQPLNVNTEQKVLAQALAPLTGEQTGAKKVELTWLTESSVQHLQDALRQSYHVLHFVGHGDYDEARDEAHLVFTNEKQESVLVSSQWLAALLRDSSVRFIFLNSCASGKSARSIAGELVRRGVAAALGIQSDIRDEVAIALTYGFYKALSDRLPVDAALVEARKSLLSISASELASPEWVQPILYMRSPDGYLFS
ncbi:MAG: CHAT domain-containing protein [Caldilineaceae bacterium]